MERTGRYGGTAELRHATHHTTPSDLGGDGWVPRTAAHHEEVAAGTLWHRCGYRSEVAPLREVVLARPPDSLERAGDAPGGHLMSARVDLGRIREQADAVAEAYLRHGVTVHLVRPPAHAGPNLIFMRDLFLATPQGVVLGRPASAQRAGEERFAAVALAALGVPLLRTPAGTATFEGADALWLGESTVVVGCGFRTNPEGAAVVGDELGRQGVETVVVPLGPGVQHLLGSLVFVDRRRVLLHAAAATAELRALLHEHGYEVIELPPEDEVVRRRAMNLVTLAPGVVLMPAGCPDTRRRLEAAGLYVDTVEVGEYVKAAGALGCLTGILLRDDAGAPAGRKP